jgi:hypothetical protein
MDSGRGTTVSTLSSVRLDVKSISRSSAMLTSTPIGEPHDRHILSTQGKMQSWHSSITITFNSAGSHHQRATASNSKIGDTTCVS